MISVISFLHGTTTYITFYCTPIKICHLNHYEKRCKIYCVIRLIDFEVYSSYSHVNFSILRNQKIIRRVILNKYWVGNMCLQQTDVVRSKRWWLLIYHYHVVQKPINNYVGWIGCMEEGTSGSFLSWTLFLLLPCPTVMGPSLYVMWYLRALWEDGIVLKGGLKSKSRDNLLLIFHFKRKAKEKSMTPLPHMEKSALVLTWTHS